MLNRLLQPLAKNITANAARLRCFALLINAVMIHKTVNLAILATADDGRSCSNQSRYRRFQDFFQKFNLDLVSVTKIILGKVPKPDKGYMLAMDRTNWEFGKTTINFLVISIIVQNASIPLIWTVLPRSTKGGNSNAAQRIKLFGELLGVLSIDDIHVLTMDREFIGKAWLSWLEEKGIAFVVRIKKNAQVGGERAEDLTGRPGAPRTRAQTVFGLQLHFASKKINKGGRESHLMVVSNRFVGREACRLYARRWGIERLFGHIKRNGFDLETTHLTAGRKLEVLLAVVSLAFLFSFAWGCRLRVMARAETVANRRKSLFRRGLEDILRLMQVRRNTSTKTGQPPDIKEFGRWLATDVFNEISLV